MLTMTTQSPGFDRAIILLHLHFSKLDSNSSEKVVDLQYTNGVEVVMQALKEGYYPEQSIAQA